ncbi:MAG: hypothetical protein ABR910_12750 [Acidobacteriaceae bacterium]|jgi:hypothetical protein
MADRLYLSLWYPNFRLESLPAALTGVLRQFAVIGAKRISAASAYPINFTEPPTYQRIYVNAGPEPSHHPPGSQSIPDTENPDSLIEDAVAEATEQLHDDMAYEFEMRWQLWTPEEPTGDYVSRALAPGEEDDLDLEDDPDEDPTPRRRAKRADPASPDDPWRLRPHTVRILGFGPRFDMAGFEQNGHLLVDFGLDTPWVLDSAEADETGVPKPLDFAAQLHIQQNVEKLLAFTLLVEKNCGISSRLLWTESGEPLAEKLIARLQRVN